MEVWSPGVRKLTKWGVLSVTIQSDRLEDVAISVRGV